MWPELWIAVVPRQSGALLRPPQIRLQVHGMLYDGTPHGNERMKYRPESTVSLHEQTLKRSDKIQARTERLIWS